MNRAVGAPLLHRLQRLPAVFDEFVVDDVDLAGRRQDGDQTWNGVHEQARIVLAFAQCFIGYGELARALRDAFIQFLGGSPLFGEVCVLQTDGRLVRGDVQEQSLGLRWKVGPVRSGDNDTDLTVEPETRGRDRQIDLADGRR